jgi:hypothetical protein
VLRKAHKVASALAHLTLLAAVNLHVRDAIVKTSRAAEKVLLLQVQHKGRGFLDDEKNNDGRM